MTISQKIGLSLEEGEIGMLKGTGKVVQGSHGRHQEERTFEAEVTLGHNVP